MEAFCTPGANQHKSRQSLNFNGMYHNVPSRNLRHFGGEYTIANCTRTVHSGLWQDSISPQSCTIAKKSRGRLCSMVLAVASFIVLIAVLSIGGLAFYMGALHTESTSSLISYTCSARILSGDKLLGMMHEKAVRYRIQFENLYQRSVLGPALVGCTVEKFDNLTNTIYFRLTFNKKKLTRSSATIEKTIRDILLTDAISRKPVFRNIRFDAKNVLVRPNLDNDTLYQRIIAKKPKETITSKNGVVTKPTVRQNITLSANLPIKKKSPLSPPSSSLPQDEINIDEKTLPVIQGSFKISKTDADIIEKKGELTTIKTKFLEKYSTLPPKKTTQKDPSVTSALYKIAAIEKVQRSTTTTIAAVTKPLELSTTNNPTKVHITPDLFNEEPWIPIVPDKNIIVQTTTITPLPNEDKIQQQPVYTSFTNSALSNYSMDNKKLSPTNFRGHPIPVNKISTITESPVTFASSDEIEIKSTTEYDQTPSEDKVSFVEIETVQYVPGTALGDKSIFDPNSTIENKQSQELKNLSSIFHDLASTLDLTKFNFTKEIIDDIQSPPQEEKISGQGQVEVVDGDEATLMMQTTKLPLVTLIPVKSNSGIGRPLRKRPNLFNKTNSGDLAVEDRSFPSNYNINSKETFLDTESVTPKHKVDQFNVVGVLNFATENILSSTTTSYSEITRVPKMGSNNSNSQITVYAINSSVSTTRVAKHKNSNLLTPEQIKQLSAISKIYQNFTKPENEAVLSTKAIPSSFKVNHPGFKILTKTLNKVFVSPKDEKIDNYISLGFSTYSNNSDCGNLSIRCGDGQCLPQTTKCNQLIDCNDGVDEQDCNCADYLRSQYLLRKICDGVVDCWDYTDENQCEWCKPNQYVCGNSKVCIDREKICDGLRDCPQGDDERQCVTIAPNLKAADEFPYYSQGYLMVRKFGKWGKLCVENFQNVTSSSQISWEISDLGKAICKSMTYQTLDSIQSLIEKDSDTSQPLYFELAYSGYNETKPTLSFKDTKCEAKKIVKVKCVSLECGARPQAIKHIARIVGGDNAALGAWPWQAALYKEGEFQCGATLLTDRWLISAGHCFYHSKDDHWVARLGALRRGTALPSPYEQLRSITRIEIHPGYMDSGFINDISLLRMEFPVVFSDYVRPICLPNVDESLMDGRLCTVVGWGQLFEIGRIFPDTLQEVQVPIISTGECRKRTIFLPLYKITDDMFCAGYERGGRDACLGDSGGPLMCPQANGRWVLHGITSNGYGCARASRPGVYTKVANYVTWIRSHFENDNPNTTNINKRTCLGHRCPLGECLPKSRLCNGYIECSDGSDERNC